ncbi:MAG: Hsp70 family protein [Pirellulales bacterium]|nr:Hsp70 family protein [Pirellulales bacterium]
MTREIPIGIDLGTTFSAVSYIDHAGHTLVIRNAEGEILTPSVVLFGENEVIVGKEARNAAAVQPDLVAQWVKRDMGSPFYTRPIHGQKLPPEVIQGCILRKLKLDIQRTLGRVDRVVVTVPAYFDEIRRKGTADAAEMAGLKILDIVNEPTAAALAFGETLGYLSPTGAPQKEMTIFAYDLGGGTFDATLLKLAPGDIRTLATDGDVMLGGHDWDLRLADFAADAFQKQHGLDPRKNPAAMNRTLAAAVEAKHTLSARVRASLRVEMAGRASEVQITREQLEEMTADLLERTSYTTRQLLAAAGLEWKDIDRLLLVGGSTRMPMVVNALRRMSGLEPDHTVNPDEAVARGAALYAGYLLAKESGDVRKAAFEITNVNSHSLGVEGIDPDTLRKKNFVLIPRNTSLPAKATERFSTKMEGQRSIVLRVLEGESTIPGECTAIGRTAIRDLPAGLIKGWPIDVTFEYGSNGRLSVHAVVPGTSHEAKLDLERDSGMTREGIEQWKRSVGEAAGFNSFESMLQDVLGINIPLAPSIENPEASPLRAPTDGRSAGATECSGPGVRAYDSAPLDDSPAEKLSPIPPCKPGASALRTFAAKPQSLAGAAPLWEEAEHIPVENTVEFAPEKPNGKPPSAGMSLSRVLFNAIGFAVFSAFGLALGYAILHYIMPDKFKWPW